ncbi:hypothetical protein M9H77_16867 [Catharanthus roseus]|uniref:Uncharacterized protein n=1 Tax=Catharanthus roseus TaxID=4058 RepID=A0ACC0B2Z8_CATRO|nr:hypothetical protein M9H77_16867 [Catharanthus roseus]
MIKCKRILNSWCSHHMTGIKTFLSNIQPSLPYTITLPNGSKTTGIEMSSVRLDSAFKINDVTSKSSLEPTQEPETNEELVTPSNSIPDPPSIPETLKSVLEDSDEKEEHPEAQAQALRDYQLARDRFFHKLRALILMKFFLPSLNTK